MANIKKVAIYARVSTDDKGQNPESQLQLLREYCQAQDWPYQEYVEYASGKTTDRKALNQLKDDIARHRINCVVIYKLDRLARSLRHLLELVDDWGRRGVDLISLTETIDTTSPQGRLVFQIFGAMAEFERGLIAERVKAGMGRAKKEGIHTGRPKLKVKLSQELIDQISQGKISVSEAGRQLKVSRMTIARRLAQKGITIDTIKDS